MSLLTAISGLVSEKSSKSSFPDVKSRISGPKIKAYHVFGGVIVVIVLIIVVGLVALAAIPFVFIFYIVSQILGVFGSRKIKSRKRQREKPFSFSEAVFDTVGKN